MKCMEWKETIANATKGVLYFILAVMFVLTVGTLQEYIDYRMPYLSRCEPSANQ